MSRHTSISYGDGIDIQSFMVKTDYLTSNYYNKTTIDEKIAQINSSILNNAKVVSNISERDALNPTASDSFTVWVVDATGDPSVTQGSALYGWTGTEWVKIAESESMDLQVTWDSITNKPNGWVSVKGDFSITPNTASNPVEFLSETSSGAPVYPTGSGKNIKELDVKYLVSVDDSLIARNLLPIASTSTVGVASFSSTSFSVSASGTGVVELKPASTSTLGGIKYVAANVTDSGYDISGGGVLTLRTASQLTSGVVKLVGSLEDSSENTKAVTVKYITDNYLSNILPSAVGANNNIGNSSKLARADHTHKGISSIFINDKSSTTEHTNSITISAGSNISFDVSGNVLTINGPEPGTAGLTDLQNYTDSVIRLTATSTSGVVITTSVLNGPIEIGTSDKSVVSLKGISIDIATDSFSFNGASLNTANSLLKLDASAVIPLANRPIATASEIGNVSIGAGLSVTEAGIVSVNTITIATRTYVDDKIAALTIPTYSTTLPVAIGGTSSTNIGAIGTNTTYARSDHKHALEFATSLVCGGVMLDGTTINSTSTPGTISAYSLANSTIGDDLADDLNNYTTPGCYLIDEDYANLPVSKSLPGYLKIYRSLGNASTGVNNALYQMLFDAAGSVYYRIGTYSGSSWSMGAWQQLLTSTNTTIPSVPSISTTINSASTNTTVPGTKAVYDALLEKANKSDIGKTLTITIAGESVAYTGSEEETVIIPVANDSEYGVVQLSNTTKDSSAVKAATSSRVAAIETSLEGLDEILSELVVATA